MPQPPSLAFVLTRAAYDVTAFEGTNLISETCLPAHPSSSAFIIPATQKNGLGRALLLRWATLT